MTNIIDPNSPGLLPGPFDNIPNFDRDYPNRWNSPRSRNWKRVLFTPDRKSQAAELLEMQNVLVQQQTDVFNSAYSGYFISKPITLSVQAYNTNSYTLAISSGQVYIDTIKFGGVYIDIQEDVVSIPLTGRTTLGINYYLTYSMSDSYRDPMSGSVYGGDLGMARLILNYRYIFNGDAFPIAIIDGQGGTNLPIITYYGHNSFSNQTSSYFLPDVIGDEVYTRFYEESGNFIAEGIYLTLPYDDVLSISPGLAYINGRPISLYHSFNYSLTPLSQITTVDTIYNAYLDYKGVVYIVEGRIGKAPTNSIHIGRVYYNPSVNINNLYFGSYEVKNTTCRSVSNSEIELIGRYEAQNELDTIQYALDMDTINQAHHQSIQLSGILTDTFSNLDKTDVSNSLFNASVNGRYNALRTGFTTTLVTLDNTGAPVNTNFNIVKKNGRAYYGISSFSQDTIIASGGSPNNYITLAPTSRNNNATLSFSPSTGIPDPQSRQFSYESVGDLPNAAALISSQGGNRFTVTQTLAADTIYASVVGLSPSENNLSVLFGKIAITAFTITTGSYGNSLGTLQADTSGNLSFSFDIPSNLPTGNYIITISNQNTAVRGEYTTLYDAKGSLTQLSNIQTLGSPQVAGIFTPTTSEPHTQVIIDEVVLAIRDPGPNTSSTLLQVSIVSYDRSTNTPGNKVLGQGYLYLSDVVTSADGSQLSPISLDIPCILDIGSTYAMVVDPLSNVNVQLFTLVQSTPAPGSFVLFVPDLLTYDNGWVPSTNTTLSFNILGGYVSTPTSSVVVKVSNTTGTINALEVITRVANPSGTCTNLSYSIDGTTFLPLSTTGPTPIPNSSNLTSAFIRFTLNNNSDVGPILDLSSTRILMYNNLVTSTWVSKEVTYTNSYSNVIVTLNSYIPTNSSIKVLISSNHGQTWDVIPLTSSVLSDGNIPLYSQTYSSSLTSTVPVYDITGGSTSIYRKTIIARIDITASDDSVVPYVQRLAVSTH